MYGRNPAPTTLRLKIVPISIVGNARAWKILLGVLAGDLLTVM